jgi:hypothetical protein
MSVESEMRKMRTMSTSNCVTVDVEPILSMKKLPQIELIIHDRPIGIEMRCT